MDVTQDISLEPPLRRHFPTRGVHGRGFGSGDVNHEPSFALIRQLGGRRQTAGCRSLQPDNFPSNIFLHLLIQGFPYALSWIWTIYGIVWYVVLGAIAGAMNRK